MGAIYNSRAMEIDYSSRTKRAFITINNDLKFKSIAFIQNSDDSSCWDHFKAFFLKHFTWTWISVKDAQGKDTDQIVNITSIAKHVGITPKEIKKANKAGNLYVAIEEKLKASDLPKTEALHNLVEKSKEIVEDKGYVIDDSSETAFLQTIAVCYEKDRATFYEVGILFASFAIKHFKYLDIAEDWMKTNFGYNHISVNNFQRADISFRGSVVDGISFVMAQKLGDLK